MASTVGARGLIELLDQQKRLTGMMNMTGEPRAAEQREIGKRVLANQIVIMAALMHLLEHPNR